jgi:uncharacterized protein (DUF2141 family)
MSKLSIIVTAFLFTHTVIAFSILPHTTTGRSQLVVKSKPKSYNATPFFLDEVDTTHSPIITKKNQDVSQDITTARRDTIKVKKPNHKEGVFSPIVFASKKLVGDETINKIRANFISLHSNIITEFVQTHESPIGTQIAKTLFVVMDANGDGTLDKDELKVAFESLGFTWLKDKQIEGILQRADLDNNGVIDYDEFKAELSKTLKTNLIKLAKKNGEEMGLLV